MKFAMTFLFMALSGVALAEEPPCLKPVRDGRRLIIGDLYWQVDELQARCEFVVVRYREMVCMVDNRHSDTMVCPIFAKYPTKLKIIGKRLLLARTENYLELYGPDGTQLFQCPNILELGYDLAGETLSVRCGAGSETIQLNTTLGARK